MAAKRQTVIGLTAGSIIAVAIGILGILHATAFDPETVKTELQSRIDQLYRIPENDPISREALAKELLANDSYKQHAKALYLKVERAYPKFREAAQRERAAQKEVPPFLSACKLPAIPPDVLARLIDEGNAHLINHGGTRFGDELRRAVEALKKAAAAVVRCTAPDVLALAREVQKQTKEGRFAEATAMIGDFEKKYVNASEFESQLRELRQQVVRKAAAAGLPLPALEAAVRELKPR